MHEIRKIIVRENNMVEPIVQNMMEHGWDLCAAFAYQRKVLTGVYDGVVLIFKKGQS